MTVFECVTTQRDNQENRDHRGKRDTENEEVGDRPPGSVSRGRGAPSASRGPLLSFVLFPGQRREEEQAERGSVRPGDRRAAEDASGASETRVELTDRQQSRRTQDSSGEGPEDALPPSARAPHRAEPSPSPTVTPPIASRTTRSHVASLHFMTLFPLPGS